MKKYFNSLGLMSGTSGDGVDASIIQSDGDTEYRVIKDKYFKYNRNIYKKIHNLKDKIKSSRDLKKFSNEIDSLEKEITFFHVKVVKNIIKNCRLKIDLIGFHGQTIYHNARKKISKQLGQGEILSQLTKKLIIYNFRQNDLKNGGQGAPLTPIYHKLLAKKFKIKQTSFLNLGGIANQTNIYKNNTITASDVGPGMCLIDQWIRNHSKEKYDKSGNIAKAGKVNKLVLKKVLNNKSYKKNHNSSKKVKSYDTNDFNLNFVRDLSFKDGAATLTEYTVLKLKQNLKNYKNKPIIVCGGGRKNKFLLERFKKYKISLKLIDDLGVNGDFVESQAFAYLAIRSYLNLPISFPETTGVKKPCLGGSFRGTNK